MYAYTMPRKTETEKRMHIFLKSEYQQKIMDNKEPTETCTGFIERCIDKMITSKTDDKEAFNQILALIQKMSEKTSV